jgi:hypothetical protein
MLDYLASRTLYGASAHLMDPIYHTLLRPEEKALADHLAKFTAEVCPFLSSSPFFFLLPLPGSQYLPHDLGSTTKQKNFGFQAVDDALRRIWLHLEQGCL